MLTKENMPWIDYLEIDEKTGERKLNPNTPNKIKETYQKHQREIQKYINNKTMIPK